jgi:hypothetical protein
MASTTNPLLKQSFLTPKMVTASKTLTGTDSGTAWTNTNATADVTLTLPKAIVNSSHIGGLQYTFLVSNGAHNINVAPLAGDAIRGVAVGTPYQIPGGLGSVLTLVCLVSGYWETVGGDVFPNGITTSGPSTMAGPVTIAAGAGGDGLDITPSASGNAIGISLGTATGFNALVVANSAGKFVMDILANGNFEMGTFGNTQLSFYTNNASRVFISGQGAVEIAAPSTATSCLALATSNYPWLNGANLGTIDLGLAGGIFGYTDGQMSMVSNGYFDGSTWRYKRVTQNALEFSLTAGGDFQWLSGGSGAAGGAFTFATRMTLLQNGNAGFGTNYCASPDSFWGAYKGVVGSTAGIRIGYSTTQDNYYDADNHYFRTSADSSLMTVSGSTGISVTVTSSTTSPAAGGAGALPATPTGYMQLTINGTVRRIPYYT